MATVTVDLHELYSSKTIIVNPGDTLVCNKTAWYNTKTRYYQLYRMAYVDFSSSSTPLYHDNIYNSEKFASSVVGTRYTSSKGTTYTNTWYSFFENCTLVAPDENIDILTHIIVTYNSSSSGMGGSPSHITATVRVKGTPQVPVNVSGTKKLATPYVNVGGTKKEVSNVYMNVNGNKKELL